MRLLDGAGRVVAAAAAVGLASMDRRRRRMTDRAMKNRARRRLMGPSVGVDGEASLTKGVAS